MGLAFLITTENLQLLSERKVLKEPEYAALLDASQVIAAARQEAQRIVTQAEAHAEEHQRWGYEEGLQAARAEVAQRLVSQALAAERQLRGLRSAMAGIVVKAVGQFMADADPALLIEAALLRVDTLIRGETFVSVRVAPTQEGSLRQALARLSSRAEWTLSASVQADPSLPDGTCIVSTSAGTIEVGVNAQLDAFRRAMELGGAAAAGST
jgi:type III secretion protein L